MVILFSVLVVDLIFDFFFIPVLIITYFAAGLCVLDGGTVVILVFLV